MKSTDLSLPWDDAHKMLEAWQTNYRPKHVDHLDILGSKGGFALFFQTSFKRRA